MEAKEFHKGMASGISEWNKGGLTEVSIDKSIMPSKNSTDQAYERSQTLNYMAMESRRSSKRTNDENRSTLKKSKKLVKKKKKKVVKLTSSMVISRRKPSQNEDISGILKPEN